MQYGKNAVKVALDGLVAAGRLSQADHVTLMGFRFIESPKVCVNVIPVKRGCSEWEEAVVQCADTHACISVRLAEVTKKIQQASYSGRVGKPMTLEVLGMKFAGVGCLTHFKRDEMGTAFFILVDPQTQLINVIQSASAYGGLKLILGGAVGFAFHRLYGERAYAKLRIYMARQGDSDVEKHDLENHFLGRWADKYREEGRLRVWKRRYQNADAQMRKHYRAKYPEACKVILDDHPDLKLLLDEELLLSA